MKAGLIDRNWHRFELVLVVFLGCLVSANQIQIYGNSEINYGENDWLIELC